MCCPPPKKKLRRPRPRRRFESDELKMLRVSVSSFYDYLTVVLKTLQEFDETMML